MINIFKQLLDGCNICNQNNRIRSDIRFIGMEIVPKEPDKNLSRCLEIIFGMLGDYNCF